MKTVRLVRAIGSTLALAGALLAGGARAATGDLSDLGPSVTVGRLPAGGTVIVTPAIGAPVAAIELWYRAPSTGFGEKPQPSLARLAAQVVAASKPIVGDALGRAVAAVGGRLTITVYSDSLEVSAVVPATSAAAIVKVMTTAFFAPVVTEEGFHAAQRDVASEAFVAAFDPETLVRDAVFAQLFSAGPQHFPVLGAPREVANISLADVTAFATRAFRSQNATLVVSGAVDAGLVHGAATGRPGEDVSEPPLIPELAASAGPVTKNGQPPGGGYGWVGPAIADRREATALDFIADYLFRPDDGVVSRQVSERFPDSFVVGQFITLHDPGVMFIAYVGKEETDLRALVDAGISAMHQPLGRQAFADALASFKYHILSDLQTPEQIADNFGWYSVEGAPEYAPGANGEQGAYFKAADSLTPEFVAAVARTYLAIPGASVLLTPEPKARAGSQ